MDEESVWTYQTLLNHDEEQNGISKFSKAMKDVLQARIVDDLVKLMKVVLKDRCSKEIKTSFIRPSWCSYLVIRSPIEVVYIVSACMCVACPRIHEWSCPTREREKNGLSIRVQ